MVIGKFFFFTHECLAKAYAYNKMVEGVYGFGYYENLGNVILKRILLLVIVLDKAKSCLPLHLGMILMDLWRFPLYYSKQNVGLNKVVK